MSGIKNIKKKLKGFQVRPPNVEVLKKVLLHIPYVVVFYVVNKCTWLYQYCRGSTVVDRLMVLFMNYPLAFKKLLPSIQPKSLAAGTIAAVSVWAVVYFKGKNGKKFRQGEEYGSARWGNEKDIAPFIDPVFENNILLTQTERLTMNSRPKKPKYARNKNVIVIGGSGSGKTRFYVKPQLMQMPDNVSFVVTDPKGTIIVECGKMLARGTPKKDKNGKILRDKNGRVVMAPYKIKVLNTINFAKSMHYNPFHYIRSEKDILKLVNTIMVNTKGEGEKSSEDFWTKAERLLYCALIGYIYYEAPEEEQNFSTLLEFINASETREEDEEFKNAVDLLFEELERDEPNHFAVRQYKKYKLAAGKTAKSILISCGARLAPFDIAELRELTSYDEMELDMIGDQRTALFIVISDTDDTFNFVVAMMYSQLFNLLCDRADDVHHGRLPYHVRILCDEFANIGQIPKFDKLIATIRSREISASIILQSQSQLKTIYKDAAETITGNCDTMLFLGGKESTTLKEISETLGKETIDLYNTSDTRGQSRSYGLNYQKTGKELMSRDELAVMDGNKCILQLRGVRPFYSDKFDITKHKRYKQLEPVEKTIIDRCVRLVYQDYLADPVPEKMPILEDLYNLLRKQEEPEAQRLATALEIYVNGSLKVFNHRTNVELNNRLVCFDIKDLGKQLKKLGMLIVQDQVWNRVTVNRAAHKSTRYYIDEFHLLLKEEQTAAYSVEIWKRFRKWGGIPTGITQNVKDLLASREIENIFENSDFILMLNQASGDRQILAKQLNISPHQLSYVTNSGAGEGLIFYGNTIIPFKDRFDNSLMLYALMSSKPEDVEKREKLGIKDRDD